MQGQYPILAPWLSPEVHGRPPLGDDDVRRPSYRGADRRLTQQVAHGNSGSEAATVSRSEESPARPKDCR